ncbi:MAG: protein phosphatase 2C domain-containing protein [Roseburia sp.]|nr:protein phosphatase 2C domain-containing protein [Ruminococcus sp.]MCM1155459.1 protein phosphatase 2C domain-containing protein [Roseburia sp.]MCM1241893.1 protein phosphatase 2C domain-containing protein [Roseburia sp.]
MICYASCTDTGGRPYNEDSVDCKKIDDDRICVVLADGLGGHGGGEIASKEAVKLILEGWNGSATPALLCDLAQAAHRRILSLQTPVCKMKTTVVILSIENNRAQWAHAGDSRLYHFIDGKLVFQTCDHSSSQIAVLMGQIKPEEIRFHEDRSHIFRALGQESNLNADAKEEELSPGKHAFLLCTDGFWEYVYEKEMEQELQAADSPQDWLERMRSHLEGRAEDDNDNNTAAAVWITI